MFKERRWVLFKIPRCDIDGVGEGKLMEVVMMMMMMFITIIARD